MQGSKSLNLATINIESLRTNLAYLHHLLGNSHIVCIQEHWLFDYETPTLAEILPGYNFQVKCVDSGNPISPAGRPKGAAGVMTIWRHEIDNLVTPLPDGSNRLLATQIGDDKQHAIIIINTYMPTDGSKDSYNSILDEVFEVFEKYGNQAEIVWLGDMNASLERTRPSTNDLKFRKFIKEENLKSLTPTGQSTYYHFWGNITSTIDHIIVRKNNGPEYQPSWIECRHPINMSSHDPVMTTLRIHWRNLNPAITCNYRGDPETARRKPNWRKVDVEKYKELTKMKFEAFIAHNGLDLPPEVVVDRLYDILLDSCEEASPTAKNLNHRRNNKYPWAKDMKPLIGEIKYLFHSWKRKGRPPNHPIKIEMSQRKKTLRQMQRQLAARHRQDLLQEISEASTENKALFYKLVARQRAGSSTISRNIDFDPECDSQLEGWANYFETLASAEVLPHFDKEFHHTSKLKVHLHALESEALYEHDFKPVNEDSMAEFICSLKNGKAADVYGLTAEHIKLASEEIILILTKLTNDIYKDRKLPDKFKVGAIVPALKKNKPARSPDSYRRITIASNMGKLVERSMMKRTQSKAVKLQDPLQYGFTSGVSPSFCALMVTEAVAEALDKKQELYLTFMDSSKAFDMVDHTMMLASLADMELDPQLWLLYRDMYGMVTSRVRIGGELSRCITEERGIRQGGETSTEIFKAKENKFLNRVRLHPDSYKIGSVSVGIPTVADDNCMISSSHTGAQTQLLLAQDNASRMRYLFSTNKSKVMHLNSTDAAEMPLYINGREISYTKEETHLRLIRTADGKSSQAVSHRIQTGRRTTYALMGAGLHGINGVSPQVSKKLLNAYVDPAVLYRLEALILSDRDYQDLDKWQRSTLRQIQGLPESTAVCAVYLLIGILPLTAQVHMKILTLFNSICNRHGSVEHEILARQLAVKDMHSHSWTTSLREIASKYQLPSPHMVMANPQSKTRWKRKVRDKVTAYWEEKLKLQAKEMKSLKLLNIGYCKIGSTHPVWSNTNDPMQVTMACTKAALLTGRYPLTSMKCSGKRRQENCPLCRESPETMSHFLLECQKLKEPRISHFRKIKPIIDSLQIKEPEDIVRFIIDPSWYLTGKESEQVEQATRRLCFSLHNSRSIQLEMGSATARALNRRKAQKKERN